MTKPKRLLPTLFSLTKQEAAEFLGCSIDALDNLRGDAEVGWIQGLHWQKLPRIGIRYNAELLRDWFVNAHDSAAHQRAIANFQASLLSNQKRRPKSA